MQNGRYWCRVKEVIEADRYSFNVRVNLYSKAVKQTSL